MNKNVLMVMSKGNTSCLERNEFLITENLPGLEGRSHRQLFCNLLCDPSSLIHLLQSTQLIIKVIKCPLGLWSWLYCIGGSSQGWSFPCAILSLLSHPLFFVVVSSQIIPYFSFSSSFGSFLKGKDSQISLWILTILSNLAKVSYRIYILLYCLF